MLMRQLTSAASTPAAVVFVILAGCSVDGTSDANARFDTDSDSELARAALESPILSCQDDRRQCIADAARDIAARQACDATLASCLQTAADKAQATAKALQACRNDGLKCVRNGGKQSECRAEYNACTKAAVDNASGEDSADGGSEWADAGQSEPVLPTLDGGSSTPGQEPPTGKPPTLGGGFPGVGKLPPAGGFPLPSLQLDGGLLDDLPPAEKCIVELRICAFTHPTSAQDCATTAQTCLANTN